VTNGTVPPKKQPIWLIYVSLALSGFILLSDAYSLFGMNRWGARTGIGLLFIVFALLVGNGRQAGIFAAAIMIVCVAVTMFI
jgi:hypothetical protein